MKIIISPSKTKKFDTISLGSDIIYQEKNKYLENILTNMNKSDLKALLKYEKVGELDYTSNVKTKAILAYSGLVFKNLNIKKNMDKLYILSAYYGILRPNDNISNYRLDMNNNIVKNEYKNMYEFWENIYDFFIDEDFIINLASSEYSKMVNNKNMITIEFYIKNKKGVYTIQSTNSKIMRAKFTSHILNENIFDKEKIKLIDLDNFSYSEKYSTESVYRFYKI
ncbi:YaaA family protein [Oceanivirga miroungae]|uniref:Uncharacterized protein n=1 Tax=Oceanivirga miroungae TaxID=1130046 RepID=A0A6I8M696_9FUSO|nr:YaaA family protein [Oceanivirga miroungae]VWL84881.1 hypothetical protein OMES3154_00138 [Oceanivirga miroungae]